MIVFLVALIYGFVAAALLYGAYWLYLRGKGRRSGFSWTAVASLWIGCSVAILVVIFATWEGD